MSGIMKAQIDWIPLSIGAVRPTQGKTLAVMQVSGGSQSFNAVNQLRVLGRWMRMLTIPNPSYLAKAYNEFDEAGRMKQSAYYDRVVDVIEELGSEVHLLFKVAAPPVPAEPLLPGANAISARCGGPVYFGSEAPRAAPEMPYPRRKRSSQRATPRLRRPTAAPATPSMM